MGKVCGSRCWRPLLDSLNPCDLVEAPARHRLRRTVAGGVASRATRASGETVGRQVLGVAGPRRWRPQSAPGTRA
ncbi:hypothetical protein WJX81_004245 [Elliptochloris bilobata]|uniref:Uncharacterized protein n=1 Tax=Elliptochloris bilobata TaxID=381761 RepID=A0AAW1R349_9CHLO